MSQIRPPDSAFSMLRQRRPRQRAKSHLAFIATLPCLICGARNVEAAHLRAGNPRYGKRTTGMAEKPDDAWSTPLCTEHHRQQHMCGNEVRWWHDYGIDPFAVALSLWKASGDEEAALQIIRENAP